VVCHLVSTERAAGVNCWLNIVYEETIGGGDFSSPPPIVYQLIIVANFESLKEGPASKVPSNSAA
jgi:hypothetical protein